MNEAIGSEGTFDFFSSMAIADRLRARSFPVWAETADAYTRSARPVSDPRFTAFEILVGEAAGHVCGRRLDSETASFISDVRERFYFETLDFVAAMEAALAANQSGADELVRLLRERAEDEASVKSKALALRDSTANPEISERRRFREAWEGPFRRQFAWVRDTAFYEALRRISPATYLDVIETYPQDEGIYSLLEAADREATCEELIALLAEARPAFDASGIWQPESRAALILLDLLRERIFEEKPDAEFTSDLAVIVETLEGRPDGQPLAYAWMQRLMNFHGKSRRPFRTYKDVNAAPILASITGALAARFTDLAHPIEWVKEEDEFWRKERVYTLVAFAISRSPVNKAKLQTLLEEALFADLVGSFGLDRLLADQRSFECLIVGNAIVALEDAAVWFDRMWDRLFWQRERARTHRNVDKNLPNAGQVICIWAALALAYFPPASQQGARLWVSIERAVRESSLMDWFRQTNDVWSLLLRFLGALWMRTFPHDPPQGEPGSLDDFLSGWLQVDPNLGSIAIAMRSQGISPLRLGKAGISAELLRRVVQDATLRGIHALMQKIEADSVLALAHEIDAAKP